MSFSSRRHRPSASISGAYNHDDYVYTHSNDSSIGLAVSQGHYSPRQPAHSQRTHTRGSVSSSSYRPENYEDRTWTSQMPGAMPLSMSRRRRSTATSASTATPSEGSDRTTSSSSQSTAIPISSRIFRSGVKDKAERSESRQSAREGSGEHRSRRNHDERRRKPRHEGTSSSMSGSVHSLAYGYDQEQEQGHTRGHRQKNGTSTPKKPRSSRHGAAKTSAKDVAELTDFQLGDCLGKGAFGSVYRALNWGSGQTVAVKQIRLADLPKSELRVIMQEIDLLKNLDHPNIVKYHGFVKSAETLNIILEYCENGSLHSISKNFGRFPENLVSLYMSQVLHGLLYLHEQGVIHRDIKGANILTTKEGLVKLADFGVASKATGLHEASVVGTPYWMAPEVIELTGASTASDIWSLGCTVIELLDGKPPYADTHNPLQALFRIVNDDHPPLPQGASPAVTDFLMQCFQKDPNLRVSAKKLLKHPWIVNAKRSDAVDLKTKSTEYEEAVRSVQEWNEALRSPNATTAVKRPFLRPGYSPSPSPVQKEMARQTILSPRQSSSTVGSHESSGRSRSGSGNDDDDDDNWDDDFVTAISPSSLHLPHLKPHDNFGGLLSSEKLKSIASQNGAVSETIEEESAEHREGLAEESNSLNTHQRNASIDSETQDTIRPYPHNQPEENVPPESGRTSKARNHVVPSLTPGPGPVVAATASVRAQNPPRPAELFQEDSNEEDYSDLVADNESVFEKKIANVSFAPPETKGVDFIEPAEDQLEPNLDDTFLDDSQLPITDQPAAPPPKKLAIARRKSTRDISRFAEDETDEDFADIIVDNETTFDRPATSDDKSSPASTLQLSTKLSNNSWLGDVDDEDDPFAQLEEGLDEMDLEANIARDKYARLRNQVEELVASLKTSQDEDALFDISEQLVVLFTELPETKSIIVSAHGLLPILEILDTCRHRDVISNLLKIVNAIIFNDYEVQENLCFVGGIPIINRFASKKYPREIRLEAAVFVQQMYQSSVLTLQMFVSAGGLNVLVEFLEDDYEDERDLVLIGVNGIWSVFDLQGSTPKNDFCRILSRNSVLDPLSLVLSRVLDEEGELAEVCEGRIAHIFLIFSQAESYVKEMVAERTVLHRVLKELKRMSPPHQITMLKFVKNLSMLSTTLDSLQNSNAIDVLTELLRSTMKGPHFREVSNQILNTIYNMCRLSKSRQEDAALNGIIPLLQKIVKTERPLKEFALPILCDMAHSGKVGRRELWRNRGLDFYVSLLSDPYWQVTALDAIFTWLQEETARVEEYLLDAQSMVPSFSDCIARCVTVSKANAFENLLEPLQKLLRLSPAIAETLARPDMFARIGQKLHHTKPAVRVNLLRILSTICESTGEGGALLTKYGILDAIRELQNDPRVLVRELAGKLLISCEETESMNGSGRRRATGGFRRSSLTGGLPSALPVGGHPAPGSGQVPRTPTSKLLYESMDSARRQNSMNPRRPTSGHDRSTSALSNQNAVQPHGVKSRTRALLGHHRVAQSNVGEYFPQQGRDDYASLQSFRRQSTSSGRPGSSASRPPSSKGRPRSSAGMQASLNPPPPSERTFTPAREKSSQPFKAFFARRRRNHAGENWN